MANGYYGYQYETSPRKVWPEYGPNKSNKKKSNKTNNVRKNNNIKIKEEAKKNTKSNKKVNPKVKAIKYLAVGFIILFAISYRNSVINESFKQKENLKSELSAMKKTNEQLEISIENSLNLKNVEQAAKEKLGMQKPANNQKVYVNLPKKDYIQPATEEVILDEDVSWFQKIINGFTKSIK